LCVLAEKDVVSRERTALTAREIVCEHFVDELGDAGPVIRERHDVGLLLDGRQRVRDGHGALADVEEGVIVFGVADGHRVVPREVELGERCAQPARLVDACRQHHHRALIEDHLQLEPAIADRLQHCVLVRFPGGDDHAPDGNRTDAALDELVDEALRRGVVERLFLARLGPVEEGAVLRNDSCEQIEPWHHSLQLVELTPGHEHELAARFAQALERRERRLVDAAMVSNGAVVVAAQREIAHYVRVSALQGRTCNAE
jgi:hypothetical protein